MEGKAGSNDRSNKHFMLAASAGCKESLKRVKKGFVRGDVNKDDYANTLRANQKIQDEMKSDDRDIAEAYQRRIAARIEH